MARKYSRDNRGRFASGGTGATARGGRLKTAGGNKRATQTSQMTATPRAGTVGRGGKVKGGVKPAAKPAGRLQSPAARKDRVEQATDRKSYAGKLRALPKEARKAIQIEKMSRGKNMGNQAKPMMNIAEGRVRLISNVGKRKNKLSPGEVSSIAKSMSGSAQKLKAGLVMGNRGRAQYNPNAVTSTGQGSAARKIQGAKLGGTVSGSGKAKGTAKPTQAPGSRIQAPKVGGVSRARLSGRKMNEGAGKRGAARQQRQQTMAIQRQMLGRVKPAKSAEPTSTGGTLRARASLKRATVKAGPGASPAQRGAVKRAGTYLKASKERNRVAVKGATPGGTVAKPKGLKQGVVTARAKARAAKPARVSPKTNGQVAQLTIFRDSQRKQLKEIKQKIKEAGPRAGGLRLEKLKIQDRLNQLNTDLVRSNATTAVRRTNAAMPAVKARTSARTDENAFAARAKRARGTSLRRGINESDRENALSSSQRRATSPDKRFAASNMRQAKSDRTAAAARDFYLSHHSPSTFGRRIKETTSNSPNFGRKKRGRKARNA